MKEQEFKCVIIVDENLPMGIIANTTAILGATMGKKFPQLIGGDVTDGTGKNHCGIIKIPVPILKGNKDSLRTLQQKLYQQERDDLTVIDFSNIAQCCKQYQEYIDISSKTQEQEYQYFGIAICGDKKQVNKLTGNMPLLR